MGKLAQITTQRSQRRRQAIAVYPFLEGLEHANTGEVSTPTNSLVASLSSHQQTRLWDAIDDGRPLGALLAKALRLAPWMVKHLQRYWTTFEEYDRMHDYQGWDIDAILRMWTPATAPTSARALKRLCWLAGLADAERRPFFSCIDQPMTPRNRALLHSIIGNTERYMRLWRYIVFLNILTSWLEEHRGAPIRADLARLLGVRSVTDWWILCRRWERINQKLQQSYYTSPSASTTPANEFGILKEPVTLESYTFTRLNNRNDMKLEANRMRNCVETYLLQCEFKTIFLVHVSQSGVPVATVALKATNDEASRQFALSEIEGPNRTRPNLECYAAVRRFVDRLNAGDVPRRAHARGVQMPTEGLQAELLRQQLCIDYVTWGKTFPCTGYFEAHSRATGGAIFDTYRDALQCGEHSIDSLYRVAAAVVPFKMLSIPSKRP